MLLGRETTDHRFFAPEGVIRMDGPVPVIGQTDMEMFLAGRIGGLKVRGGTVWALGEWREDYTKPEGFMLSPSFTLNDYNVRGGRDMVVLDCTLRSVTVLPGSSWPWKED